MTDRMWLAVKYALFALAAIGVNLSFQEVTTAAISRVLPGWMELYLALAVGTLAGLVVKYILDKRYIFCFKTKGLDDDTRRFLIYSFMGVFTTLIFWGFEIGFDYLFQTRLMRYIGGATGLVIGYWVKYQLDKRFVFCEY